MNGSNNSFIIKKIKIYIYNIYFGSVWEYRKKWRSKTESRTENVILVRDDIPKILEILVWDRDFFGLVWDFWIFFPALTFIENFEMAI